MEPAVHTEPGAPAPIIDIAPPAKPSIPKTESEPAATPPTAESVEKASPAQPAPAAGKNATPKTLPIGAICSAILFFVILSGLAYYAYTKSN